MISSKPKTSHRSPHATDNDILITALRVFGFKPFYVHELQSHVAPFISATGMYRRRRILKTLELISKLGLESRPAHITPSLPPLVRILSDQFRFTDFSEQDLRAKTYALADQFTRKYTSGD